MTEIDRTSLDQRRLLLSGAVNFRDLGGYPTTDCRRVKRGLVFRSDHLSLLTPDDQQRLLDLRFKVICDLRTVREQQNAPDLLPGDGSIRLLSLPVQVDDFDPVDLVDRLREGDDSWLSLDFFINLYQRYLDDFGPVWGRVLGLLTSSRNLPLVFHCTGGKDRTGICAALLLKLLGVEQEYIYQDHLLSDVYNAERLKPIYAKFAAMGVTREKAAPYLQVPGEALVAMFEHLQENYGTVENYLQKRAGLDGKAVQALRAGLLQ